MIELGKSVGRDEVTRENGDAAPAPRQGSQVRFTAKYEAPCDQIAVGSHEPSRFFLIIPSLTVNSTGSSLRQLLGRAGWS